jgi:hypothetical protein
MMEAERTSETLVNFYRTTRPYNPEDCYLRTHRRDNLNFYLDVNTFWHLFIDMALESQGRTSCRVADLIIPTCRPPELFHYSNKSNLSFHVMAVFCKLV